jgi:hypothetical protein
MTIPPRITLNDVFENIYKKEVDTTKIRWTDYWWLGKCVELAKWYIEVKHWNIIPISKDSKLPLYKRTNFRSEGSLGPFLKIEDGVKENTITYWLYQEKNLAVCPNTTFCIADFDSETLWHDDYKQYLCMRTPNGFALPLRQDDFSETVRKDTSLIGEMRRIGVEFRAVGQYECLPYSKTCVNREHDRGKDADCKAKGLTCHKYLRYWIGAYELLPTQPEITMRQLFDVMNA